MTRPCEEPRRLEQARVRRVERPAPGHCVLRAETSEPFEAEPGQFAMLRVPAGCGAFLHRPMSILDAGPGVDFLIREVGAGSRALARLSPGERLEMTGPLGRPFPPPREGSREVLVAGGVGAAPLLFRARRAAAAGARPIAVYGGRSAQELVLAGRMQAAAERTVLVTEDGSLGSRGLATDPLGEAMEGADQVLACGPLPMMEAAARLAAAASVRCLVCLEALMACGFGACLGCAVPSSRGGYLYVCTDGPVLDARLVDWPRLAPD